MTAVLQVLFFSRSLCLSGRFLCGIVRFTGTEQFFLYRRRDFGINFRIVLHELTDSLDSLADLVSFIGEPGAGLIDDIVLHRQIDDLIKMGNSLSVDHIYRCGLEGRRNLVLDDFDLHDIAVSILAVLQRFTAADIQTHAGVELQGTAARGCLRIAEHNADLFTQLVDKNRRAAGTVHDTGEFPHRLGHEAGLQTDTGISHLAVKLRLRHKGSDRVYDNQIDGAGFDQYFGDLKGLFPGIRL